MASSAKDRLPGTQCSTVRNPSCTSSFQQPTSQSTRSTLPGPPHSTVKPPLRPSSFHKPTSQTEKRMLPGALRSTLRFPLGTSSVKQPTSQSTSHTPLGASRSNVSRPLGPSSLQQPTSQTTRHTLPRTPRYTMNHPSSPSSAQQPTSHTTGHTVSEPSHSTVSPPSGSSSFQQPTKSIIKRLIKVQPNGTVVGENQARWKTRSGHFIRVHIPIRYENWKKVPANFKDEVWNALMGEFELNVNPRLARPLLERAFPQRFRTAKSTYRNQILKGKTLEEALAACPDGMDPSHWKAFCYHEYQAEVQEANVKNSANKKKNNVGHTCGRQSYAQMHYIEKLGNPDKKVRRVDIWKKGHKHADGTVLESAKEKYELVTAAEERRKNENLMGEDNVHELDFESDELFEVYGAEYGNSVRGVSSHVSKKQLQQASLAVEILQQENSKSVAKVQADVSELKSTITSMQGLLVAVFQQLTNTGAGSSQPMPPMENMQRNENISNSDHVPTTPIYENLSHRVHSTPNTTLRVTLLDRDGTPVAKGFLVTDASSGICHGRKVNAVEKKVYIDDVLDPSAPVYDGPQDGHATLESFVEGGYLIWLEARLKLA